MNQPLKRCCIALALAGGAAVPGLAGAAGFFLLEQNGSGLGNAYAGSAAVAADASTIFFNPAGMTLLPGMQVVAAVSPISVQSEFSGTGTTTSAVALGTNTGGNAGGWAFVPSLYFSAPIGERLAIGIGVGAPFGLETEYESNWLGRFQGIRSELTTINVNPSIAFKVNDAISLGAGINWQRADAELTNSVFLSPALEGSTRLEADGDAWGWNVGALFRLGPDLRVGVAYRSTLDYTLEGNVNVTTLAGTSVAAFPAQADVEFPDIFTLSLVQQVGEKWQLLGDAQYTHWSTIGTINVVNTNNGAIRDQLAFDFNDAWRVAFGVNYFSSDKWTLRGGIAWDQSPVDDGNRTVRLPDNDRYWLAFGAQYKFGKGGAVDFGYAHLFVPSTDINRTRTQFGTPLSTTVVGEYDNSVDVLSLQITWTF